ncbi:MAG: hypothetical protein EBT92_14430 [Planctomycetes bacterium]|nr:hypothetical protein [Planctomycetota bacterium]
MKIVPVENDGKNYRLDFEKALGLGVLSETRQFNITLDEDQVAVLLSVCNRIGGPVAGARGVTDAIYDNPAIYFKD